MVSQEDYPVQTACKVLGLARSSYYYKSQRQDQSEIETAITEVAGRHPTYGTRRVTHQLRRAPFYQHINRKRTQRIMREKGLLRPVKRSGRYTTNSRHPYLRFENLVADLEITRPEQVWVGDITYIRLGREFIYLSVLMDVFTRCIRSWRLSKSLNMNLTLDALEQALQSYRPELHHSDQGIHYAHRDYVLKLQQHEVRISMADVGNPYQNGFAERLIRTIKEEEVDLSDYQNFAQAKAQIKSFVQDVYNQKRIHSALGYLTPVEFETAYYLVLNGSSTP